MSKPANPFIGKKNVHTAMRGQLWVMLALTAFIIIADKFFFNSNLTMSRSFFAGAMLSLSSQYLVALLVFRWVGYGSRHKIVNNMYLAEALKWIMTIVGFIAIFTLIKPIYAGMVMLGYILMQISHVIKLIKLK